MEPQDLVIELAASQEAQGTHRGWVWLSTLAWCHRGCKLLQPLSHMNYLQLSWLSPLWPHFLSYVLGPGVESRSWTVRQHLRAFWKYRWPKMNSESKAQASEAFPAMLARAVSWLLHSLRPEHTTYVLCTRHAVTILSSNSGLLYTTNCSVFSVHSTSFCSHRNIRI